ncbi:MAG: SAM-dependent methyltransferase [Streptosporangiales bacterium]|nr:SAM-dependent methyltransferase [Streptosporangiales bacterium]
MDRSVCFDNPISRPAVDESVSSALGTARIIAALGHRRGARGARGAGREGESQVDPDVVPHGLSVPSVPNIARAYDAALGGKDNYAVDRVFVERLKGVAPDITVAARTNRQALIRGVRFLAAEAGIRQFLDLGSGLPSAQNTHQVAQRVDPEARIVYVDKDPTVLAYGRALLVENEHTTVVTADLRDPVAVLDSPAVKGLIDFSRPVAVLLVAILHHLEDAEDPAGLVRTYLDAVPAGSYLFITHFCRSFPAADDLEQSFQTMLGSGRFRTREEIGRYFTGLEMVEPGLVPVAQWRPEGPLRRDPTVGERMHIAGIARKP